MPFRMNNKKQFLTYKNYLSIEDIKTKLSIVFKKFVYKFKVAWELPDNGNNYRHTHILLQLDRKCDFKRQDYMDFEKNHGDYKPVKTKKHFVNIYHYLDKQNGCTDNDVKLGCKYNDIVLEDIKVNQYSDLKKIIQSHKSRHTMWNDERLCNGTIARSMKWAEMMFNMKPKKKLFEHKSLLRHQQEWIDELMSQNNREVLWIYGKGKNGKTQCANYLQDNYNCYFVNSGRYVDIMEGYDEEDIIVFDLPKSSENFTPYRAMESFKDGKAFSAKFRSTSKIFGSKKVIVFANFEPDTSTMVQDRWNIIELEKDIEEEDKPIKRRKMRVYIKKRKKSAKRSFNTTGKNASIKNFIKKIKHKGSNVMGGVI